MALGTVTCLNTPKKGFLVKTKQSFSSIGLPLISWAPRYDILLLATFVRRSVGHQWSSELCFLNPSKCSCCGKVEGPLTFVTSTTTHTRTPLMTAAPHFLVVTCKLCISHVRGTYFALMSTHNIDLASDHRQSADVLQSYTTVNEQKTTQGERGKPSFYWMGKSSGGPQIPGSV